MTRKFLFFTYSFLFLLIVLTVPVLAKETEDSTAADTDRTPPAREKALEERTERIDQVCENIEERIAIKIENFENNKEHHIERYNHFIEVLSEKLVKLEEKGFDVSKIQADLETLDELVQVYAQEYAAFIDALRLTQNYVCGESEGAFREALVAAKDQWKVVVQKRREIMDFYINVIREDIKALREQASAMENPKVTREREE